MLFNSPAYLAFLFLVFVAYRLVRGQRARLHVLLGASWLFYAAWYPVYLLLFLGSTAGNYLAGKRIAKDRGSPDGARFLKGAVAANLALLAGFKYTGFALASLDAVAEMALGHPLGLPQARIFLPLGISFYTFQMIGYLVDVHRGDLPPADDLRAFSLFIAFFPQLIAGPIVRGRDLLPQLQDLTRPPPSRYWLHGLDLIFVGLFKKVLVADQMAAFVDQVFLQPGGLGAGHLLLGIYAYAAQIYCDFSGYTDIGRGSAYLLGFDLPENFDYPYLAVNITDFWRRWHITLSTWLRDYLYIPLGGNRSGSLGTYRNMLITMTLGGLWHGAAWTFVVWGLIHGLALGATRLAHEVVGSPAAEPLFGGRAYRVLAMVATFHLVCLAWVFFRAPDFGVAFAFLRGLADLRFASPAGLAAFGTTKPVLVGGALVLLGLVHGLHARYAATFMETRAAALLRPVAYAACLIAISLMTGGGNRSFIYFQF